MKRLLIPLLLAYSFSLAAVELPYQTLKGEAKNLTDHRGKWVVINYWATWCPPCLEEIPELILFHESHKDKDAIVLGFDMEQASPARLSKFIEENMISYPIVPNAESSDKIGVVPGLPTTYLINPEGEVVASQVGTVTSDMLESYINKNK
ncbi:MAG: TlpA family protein disulfide reductase [Chromatiales bacterium]|nr:TlpA family protein disulfide reductase [Chromatiales bacterium]